MMKTLRRWRGTGRRGALTWTWTSWLAAFLGVVRVFWAPPVQAETFGVDFTTSGSLDGFELHGNGIYWWNDGTIPNETTPARLGQMALRSLVAGRGMEVSSSKPYFVYQATDLRARYQSAVRGTITGSESGLIGAWKLDDGDGQVAVDSTPQGRNGALINGPRWLPSTAPLLPNLAAGQTMRFDGVEDRVQVAHQADLNAFPLTVGAWIRTAKTSPGYVAIANKYIPGSFNGHSLHVRDGRVAAFYFRDNNSFVYAGDPGVDGGFVADGQWHHVTWVVDESGGRLYVDGVQTGSLPWTGTPGACTSTAPLLFGFYPFETQTISLDGRLDELTLLNRALDVTALHALMNNRQSGSGAGLIGYWPLDERSATTVEDATGHGHTGTLQGDPTWLPSDAPIAP